MIKYKCNEGKINLEADGDSHELATDVALLVVRIMADMSLRDRMHFSDVMQVAMYSCLGTKKMGFGNMLNPDEVQKGMFDTKEYIREMYDENPELLSKLVSDITEVVLGES